MCYTLCEGATYTVKQDPSIDFLSLLRAEPKGQEEALHVWTRVLGGR